MLIIFFRSVEQTSPSVVYCIEKSVKIREEKLRKVPRSVIPAVRPFTSFVKINFHAHASAGGGDLGGGGGGGPQVAAAGLHHLAHHPTADGILSGGFGPVVGGGRFEAADMSAAAPAALALAATADGAAAAAGGMINADLMEYLRVSHSQLLVQEDVP